MNIEDLLKMSATELEAMSDKQLMEHFEPMLKFTRPELAAIERQKNPEAFGLDVNGKPKKSIKVEKVDDNLSQRAKNLAQQFGFDLGLRD